jgi:hypothetical protein
VQWLTFALNVSISAFKILLSTAASSHFWFTSVKRDSSEVRSSLSWPTYWMPYRLNQNLLKNHDLKGTNATEKQWATWVSSSFSCACFLLLERLADSRFDCILSHCQDINTVIGERSFLFNTIIRYILASSKNLFIPKLGDS